ncbi:MAG: ribonuclease R [Candidatus Methylacidiphilales bacterium]|nr:ribonuclease R [Candidatus Methylacidiphilales bacterium]
MPATSPLAPKVLRTLGHPDYQPINEDGIARKLKLSGPARDELAQTLRELADSGKIIRVRGDRWIVPEKAELLTGVISFNPKGFAFLLSETGDDDAYIPAEETGTALHQDLVVAQKIPSQAGRFRERVHARVIRVVKRRRASLVGTLQSGGRFFHVVPDDPRHLQNIYVTDPADSPLDPKPVLGDKVVVRPEDWKDRHLNPEGTIVEVLGKPGDPNVDILSVIRKYELPTEFPSAALAEVAQFSLDPQGHAFDPGPRLDLRGERVFTIDPDTARDFDDAIHIRPAGKGKWEVGIHIADVSYYVRAGGALDEEASKRGNSVYLVNQVIPMLPEELSNGLCSLLPHVDRLTHSVIVTLTETGRVVEERIARTLIHSQRRFTYQEAFARLQDQPRDDMDRDLHQAWALASNLRKNRMNNGSLDLDMPEVKVRLNDQGVPVALEKVEHDISHQLIEEFMLLANEVVARTLKNKHIPALYRVHEAPEPEKLAELRQTLLIQGIKVGDLTKRHEMQRASKAIAASPASYALKISLLKSLKRACYRSQPLGHYGLAKTNYTHFTSPIRRYADLVVHRSLLKPSERPKYKAGELEEVAARISATERNAAEAEQDTVRIKKLEFFQRQLTSGTPQSFPAVVVDVQNFGLFVEVPDFLVSGLIHISSLGSDFFNYDERQRRIIGNRSKKSFKVGDRLNVQVEKIDTQRHQIDFKLAGGTEAKRDERSSGRRGRR